MSAESETLAKVPSNLVLTAVLSSGITIVSSICYIILCIVAIVYRFNCDVAAGTPGNAQFTWHTIYQVYIKDEECDHALLMDRLTQPHTVFVLVTLTLCFSVLTLTTGIVLTVGVIKQEWSRYLNIIVIAYITCWVGSLAVDLTFASHLGMDYGYLMQLEQLRDGPEYFFALDTLRLAAFVLMSVSLKGYVTLALNMVLICLLINYSCVHQNTSNKEQHSIHKMGALNAFDQQRRVEDTWVQPDPINPYASSFSRGKTNNAYVNDAQLRSLPRSDFYHTPSQSFNRSESWQHQPQSSHGSRPFSYMEEMRRAPAAAAQPKPPAASSQEPWRREPWPAAPPVPAPDYSPHSPRRLKSALKPAGYM